MTNSEFRCCSALADVYFQMKDYQKAKDRYAEALDRSGATEPLSLQRFYRAEACRQLAAKEKPSPKFQPTSKTASTDIIETHRIEEFNRLMREAVKHYDELCSDLVQRRNRAPLSEPEEAILRDADFKTADCLKQLGNLQAARDRYELLASRYQSQVECSAPERSIRLLPRTHRSIPSMVKWYDISALLNSSTSKPSSRPDMLASSGSTGCGYRWTTWHSR